MKKTNKILATLGALTSVAVIPLTITTSSLNAKLAEENKQIDEMLESQQKSENSKVTEQQSLQQTSASNELFSADVKLTNKGTYDVPTGYHLATNKLSSWRYPISPHGVLFPCNEGLTLYEPKTNTIKWTATKDGLKLPSLGKYVISAQYDETTDQFVVVYSETDEGNKSFSIKLMLIEATTGKSVFEKEIIPLSGYYSREYYIQPVKDENGNKTTSYTINNVACISDNGRKEKHATWLLTLDKTKPGLTLLKEINFSNKNPNDDARWRATVPSQFFSYNKKLYYLSLDYWDTGNGWLNIWSVEGDTTNKILMKSRVDSQYTSDWWLNGSNNYVPTWVEEMYIKKQVINGKDYLAFGFISNAPNNKPNEWKPHRNYLTVGYINLETNAFENPSNPADTNHRWWNADLNTIASPSFADWDLWSGFFFKNKFYSYANYLNGANGGKRSIVVIDFEQWEFGKKIYVQDSYRLTTNADNNRVKFYPIADNFTSFPTTLPNTSVLEHISHILPFPSWDSDLLTVYNVREGKFLSIDMAADNTNGTLAYKTKLLNNALKEINITSYQAISADKVDMTQLTNKIKTEGISQILTQYRTDTNVTIVNRDDYNTQEGLAHLYKGQKKIDLTITLGYDGTSYVNKQIIFKDVIVNGFKKYQTQRNSKESLQVSSVLQTKSVFDVSDNELTSFLKTQVNTLFTELPNDFDSEEITDIKFKKDAATRTIEVKFKLARYVNASNTVEGPSPEYSVKLTGFATAKPSEINNVINIDGQVQFGNNYYDPKMNQSILELIKQELANEKYHLPTDFEISNLQISDQTKASEGIYTFAVSVNKYVDTSGVLQESQKQVEVKITGFKKYQTEFLTNENTTFTYTDTSITTDQITVANVQDFLLNKIKASEIVNGKLAKPLEQFQLNDYTVVIESKDYANGSIVVKATFNSNLFYNDGLLIDSAKEIKFKINGLGVKTTSLKQNTFRAQDIIQNLDPEASYKTVVEKFTNNSWNSYRDWKGDVFGLTQSLSKMFNDLPLDVTPQVTRTRLLLGDDAINANNAAQGKIKIEFTLNSVLPSNQQQDFTILLTDLQPMNTVFIRDTVRRSGNHFHSEPIDFFLNNDYAAKELLETSAYELISPFPPSPWDWMKNITMINPRPDYYNGSITYDITFTNVPTADGTNTISKTVKIVGFKTTESRVISNTINVNKPSIGLSTSDYTNQRIKQYLQENKETLFENLPPNYLFDNITIGEVVPNNNEGYYTVDIELNDVYTANNKIKFALRVEGWKNQSNTTMIPLQNTIALDFLPSKIEDDILKTAIIENGLVKNLPSNTKLEKGDIEISNRRPADFEGRITLDIAIVHNKAQEDGTVIERKEFSNVTISGLKKLDPATSTTKLNSDFTVSTDQIASDISDDALKTMMINGNLFEYLADGESLTDQDLLITDVKNDDGLGAKTVTITIINSKAKELGQPVATKKFSEVRITGFKPLDAINSTTKFVNTPVNSGLTTADIQANPNALKTIIINNNMIQNLVPGEILKEQDLDVAITDTNQKEGTIIATITVKNNKAQELGKAVPNKTFGSIGISGFKRVEESALTTTIDLSKKFANDTLPSQLSKEDIKSIIINQGLVRNITNNQAINSGDLEINIVKYDDKIGTITFDLTINNDKCQENGKPLTKKTFSNITLSGFGIEQINPNTGLADSSSIPSWVWYAIAGGFAFLLLVMIIVIISVIKSKKKQKAQIKKLTATVASYKAIGGPQAKALPTTKTTVTPPPRPSTTVSTQPVKPATPTVPVGPTPRPGTTPQRPGMAPTNQPIPPKIEIKKKESLSPKKK